MLSAPITVICAGKNGYVNPRIVVAKAKIVV